VASVSGQGTVTGLVSIIMPFLDTRESFLLEAVESVRTQTYDEWEIILIDDGSDAPIGEIAKSLAHNDPRRITYLEHDEHRHLGISASRNLGLSIAKGEFIAFLDSDDVWDEHQLEEQVELLSEHPEAGMLFGNTLYWSSWPGSTQASKRDLQYDLILRTPQLIAPPNMLKFYLQGRAITPCMTSVIIRHSVIQPNEAFEEDFTGHYEDQVFLAKVWTHNSVYVVNRVWGKYRQHEDSTTADGDDSALANTWRVKYLHWLSLYLARNNLKGTAVWRALRLQLWMSQSRWFRRSILMWREARRLSHRRCRQVLARFSAA